MLRAVPSTIFIADSRLVAFRSFILVSAIFFTVALVIFPTFSLL